MQPASNFIAPLSVTMDGVTIRSYLPGDGAALQLATTSSYEHLRPWLGWATTDQTVEQAEALCRRFYANYLSNQDFVLGIWINDELAGGTGYHLREGPLEWGNAEIGMWIRESYAGQGVGTRALRMVLAWGFETWGWERLAWRCDPLNVASARVARKAGLQFEGLMRSLMVKREGQRYSIEIYSMLRAEWEAQRDGAPGVPGASPA